MAILNISFYLPRKNSSGQCSEKTKHGSQRVNQQSSIFQNKTLQQRINTNFWRFRIRRNLYLNFLTKRKKESLTTTLLKCFNFFQMKYSKYFRKERCQISSFLWSIYFKISVSFKFGKQIQWIELNWM